MKKIERLKKSALESCNWRGHKMSRFQQGRFWQDTHTAHCLNADCKATVTVDEHPAPNGINISGWAVALECPVKE